MTSCCAQILWMKQTLLDFGMSYEHVPIKCDILSKNLGLHSHAKHIDIRHHFLHDYIQKSNIMLEFVSIKKQLVDSYTKSLYDDHFSTIRRELGMVGFSKIVT